MRVVRVIPCLDVAEGRVVKGVNFVNLRDAGDPVELAKLYDSQGADELIFLDIKATHENRATTVKMAQEVADAIFIPFTIGGGISSVDQARALLMAGADKVAVNSAAVNRPQLVSEIASEFGSQCCVVAIDARRKESHAGNGQVQDTRKLDRPSPPRFEICTHGGRRGTDIDLLDWVRQVEELGAGEILLNSIDRDGTRQGFDHEMNKLVSENSNLPLIASGGVGNVSHLPAGVTNGGADAVLAASIFHFGEATISEAKTALADAGLIVRPIDD